MLKRMCPDLETPASKAFLDAADFGLRQLAPDGDATPALRRAVEACT